MPSAIPSGRAVNPAALFLPLLILSALAALKLLSPQSYSTLVQEDALLEWGQFACYLAAGLLALGAAARNLRAGLVWTALACLLLGLVLLLAAMEEISWAERLLGYHTPDWFLQHNSQRETTLHNLGPVQSHLHLMYLLAGLWLSLGWLATGRLAAWPGTDTATRRLLACLAPPRRLCLCFLPLALLYGYFVLAWLMGVAGLGEKGFIVWRDQEVAETLLALGCLLWSAGLWRGAKA